MAYIASRYPLTQKMTHLHSSMTHPAIDPVEVALASATLANGFALGGAVVTAHESFQLALAVATAVGGISAVVLRFLPAAKRTKRARRSAQKPTNQPTEN